MAAIAHLGIDFCTLKCTKKRVEITIFVICVFCTLKCTKIGLRLIVMYVLTFLDLITFIFYIDSYVYLLVLKVSFNSYAR